MQDINNNKVRLLFSVCLAIGGSAILFFGKAPSFKSPSTLIPIICMLFYAAAVRKSSPTVSREQISDSHYYLGFLFTQIALAVSLYSYIDGRALHLSELVGTLGVAVTTSILGLYLKVFSGHFHMDATAVRKDAEAEIAIAMVNVSKELQEARKCLRTAREDTAQTVTALASHLTESMQRSGAGVARISAHITTAALEEVSKAAQSFSEKMGDMRTPNQIITEKLSFCLHDVEVVVGKMTETLSGSLAVLRENDAKWSGLGESAENLGQRLTQLSRSSNVLQTLSEHAGLLDVSLGKLASRAEQLIDGAASSNKSAEAIRQSLHQELEDIQTLSAQLNAAVKVAGDATNEVLMSLTAAISTLNAARATR